jgi:hypothetical protein
LRRNNRRLASFRAQPGFGRAAAIALQRSRETLDACVLE